MRPQHLVSLHCAVFKPHKTKPLCKDIGQVNSHSKHLQDRETFCQTEYAKFANHARNFKLHTIYTFILVLPWNWIVHRTDHEQLLIVFRKINTWIWHIYSCVYIEHKTQTDLIRGHCTDTWCTLKNQQDKQGCSQISSTPHYTWYVSIYAGKKISLN